MLKNGTCLANPLSAVFVVSLNILTKLIITILLELLFHSELNGPSYDHIINFNCCRNACNASLAM